MARFAGLISKMRGAGTGLKQDKAGRWRDKKGRFAKAPPRLRDRAAAAGSRFGRAFLSFGFGLDFGSSEDRAGGGSGGGPRRKGGASGGPDVTLPPKRRGRAYSKEANPSLDTISEQMGDLVKIAKKLGIASEKQEAELVKATQTKERADKESRLEAANDNDASMVGGGDLSGGAIGALEPEINRLIDAIRDLREKIEGQEGSGGGIGGALSAAATGAMVLGRGGLQAVGRGATAVGRGAMAAGKKVASSTDKIAAKVGIGTGKVKTNVAAAGLKGTALKRKIAEIARPLVAKGLAKTAIKSIPLVGAVAGLGFALSRLVKGDVVGAGLDAASGLAGPLTAIPALVASLARDVYHGVYGIFPEQDPLAGERLGVIKESIEDIAKEQLGQKVEKKEDKKPAAETLPSPTPRMEASAMSAPAPNQSAGGGGTGSSAEPPAGADGAPPPAGSVAGGGDAGSAPEPAEAMGEGASPGSPTDQVPITAEPPAASQEPPDVTKSGAAIEAASGEASAPVMQMGITGNTIVAPATLPTTRANATGMGDVPEPAYLNAGDLIKSIYFGSVAGAMAA
jgi:hypothetical protein